MEKQYVSFLLCDKKYAIEIENVQEITDFKDYTELPNSPKFMLGILNIRKNITLIINLKERLNLFDENKGEEKQIIVVNIAGRQMGFIIDKATGVLNLKEADIESPLKTSALSNSQFIKGVGKIKEESIVIMDLKRILSIEEKIEILKMGL